MRSVELFAGAGGLAIGMSNAGFKHAAVLEWDAKACQTFRENQQHSRTLKAWPLHQVDVRAFDYRHLEDIAVVSGGPPCQPFSLGGKHRGFSDARDMFPEAVRAVRELRPQAFIFENVKGLLRESFASYFEYVLLQLTHPGFRRKKGESWADHRRRLERRHTSGRVCGEYNVVFRLLNAANYGVPQRRERVFIVGFRSDLGIKWSFPEATHSSDELLMSKWGTGEYWKRHSVPPRFRPRPTSEDLQRVALLAEGELFAKPQAPWLTVRDALHDLPEPDVKEEIAGHRLIPGARSYPGHTGSPLDEPAKTLKAGDHGVPGGENMLLQLDGTVRYFTVREAARLQTFPDDYTFPGTWSSAMRQLGNAVPVQLGETVARSVAKAINSARQRG